MQHSDSRVTAAGCLAGVAATILTMLSGPLTADTVQMDGLPPYENVRIESVEEGLILFVLPKSGKIVDKDFSKIQYIQISGQPLFNQAEDARRGGKIEEAIDLYHKTVAGELPDWLTHVVDIRLTQSYDVRGQFDDAVRHYLKVLRQSPLLREYEPRNLPPAGSERAVRALELVDQMVAGGVDGELDESAKRLQLHVVQLQRAEVAEGEPVDMAPDGAVSGAAEVATEREVETSNNAPAILDSGELSAEERDIVITIRKALQAERNRAALTMIDGAADEFSMQSLGDLLFLKGQALVAEKDYPHAAMAFMRLVIHFPNNSLAPDAMYGAALALQQMGDDARARALLKELIRTHADHHKAKDARSILSE